MTPRVYNFSAGPAVLPEPVLRQAQEELLSLPGVGASILEISHRSGPFLEIHHEAQQNLRHLLGIPDDYAVLFLQGGSRLQFSMIPLNLRGAGESADYVLTGSWGKSALEEAVKDGSTNVAWDGKPTNYDRIPAAGDLRLDPQAAYVHVTSNETIQGVQLPADAQFGAAPLVCDCSSDFLSRPVPVGQYGMIYACAQKNAGPAGVTVVIVRKDLLDRSAVNLPGYLSYRVHADNDSLWNTPPTFAIYILNLVTRWIRDQFGDLTRLAAHNREKAELLYDALDASDGFYEGHAQPDCRSHMNVTFRLPSEDLLKKFLAEAKGHALDSLAGHRSVGGIRASIYNAMPLSGVVALRDFMRDFHQQNA